MRAARRDGEWIARERISRALPRLAIRVEKRVEDAAAVAVPGEAEVGPHGLFRPLEILPLRGVDADALADVDELRNGDLQTGLEDRRLAAVGRGCALHSRRRLPHEQGHGDGELP